MSHKLGQLTNSWSDWRLQSWWTTSPQAHFEATAAAVGAASNGPERQPCVFSTAEPVQGSHVRHETEPQEWAESRVSISLGLMDMIRTTSQEERGKRGWEEWWRQSVGADDVPATSGTRCIPLQLEHNLLIPRSTEKEPLQTARKRVGRCMERRGMKRKILEWWIDRRELRR